MSHGPVVMNWQNLIGAMTKVKQLHKKQKKE